MIAVRKRGSFEWRTVGRLAAAALVAGIALAPAPASAQFVCQDVTSGTGNGATAGANSVACGTNASASGFNAAATGTVASATGENSTAMGSSSLASGLNSTAVGAGSVANGAGTTSVGQGAGSLSNGVANQSFGYSAGYNTNGSSNTAVGLLSGANITGNQNASFGVNAGNNMIGDNNVAIGLSANVGINASDTVAIGSGAQAAQDGNIAIGHGALASHANSAAFGAGAQTTAANQMMFGTLTNTYTMSGVASAASKAAQTGPVQVVTSDAGGNLATMDIAALAGGGADLTEINSRLDGHDRRLDQHDRKIEKNTEGIAIALAMAGVPTLTQSETFAMSANWGTFEGENGFAAGGALRVGQNMQVNGGLGFGGETVGGRAGVRLGW
jgi:autotransporter adhesin